MDHELKQRLIGAVVVTALCAIFIPMLFDDPVDTKVSELPVPVQANQGADVAEKLPKGADDVLKLPDTEPVATEAVGEAIESTGAEEELAEPEMQQSKSGDTGDSLYTESPGYTQDNANKVSASEPVHSKSHAKQAVDVIEEKTSAANLGKSSLAESVKSLAPKLPPRDTHNEALKAKKAIETVKPLAAKKPDTEPSIPGKSELLKIDSLQATVKQQNAAKSLAASVAEAKKPVEVAPKSPAKLVRWYIQVGSFSKKDNAMSLWDSLREQGLPASLDTVQTDKGTAYRLRVGPELDEKKAVAMKSRLDKQNIKAILISE